MDVKRQSLAYLLVANRLASGWFFLLSRLVTPAD